MTGNFQKDSLGWQVQLLQMQISEWFTRWFQPTQGGNRNSMPFPDWSLPVEWARVLFWLITGLVVGWLLWQLYSLLNPYLGRAGTFWQGTRQQRTTSPSSQQLTTAEWLARSRTYAQQGNYPEACRALYMAVLHRLADDEILPEEASRTDGEYLNALQVLPNVQPYQVLFRTHERLCFSQTEITKATFQTCDQAYRETETP